MYNAFKENRKSGRLILSLFGGLIMSLALFTYQFSANAENSGAESNCMEPDPVLINPGIGSQSRDIFFDYESDIIREDAKEVLVGNADILKRNPDMFVIIQGEYGVNETGGKLLGQSRAQNVREFIIGQGVESGRILTSSNCYDSRQTVASTPESVELDRRVHFISIEIGQDEFASLDEFFDIYLRS